MIRTPEALIPYMLLCACVAGGALWSLESGLEHAAPDVPALHLTQLGGPFILTDQSGHRRGDKDFLGHYVLLYFGYTNCPDVCPTTLTSMADALQRLGKRAPRVTPVFVTIDPARDTAPVLASYLHAFGPSFVGLTGTPPEIAHIAKEYRVYYAKRALKDGYAMDHSGEIYLLGPDGQIVTFYDPPFDSKGLAEDLARRLG